MKTIIPFFSLIEGLFFLGFLLILLIHRVKRSPNDSRKQLWTKYGWYLAIVNAVLLMIFVGTPFFQVMVGTIIFVGLEEFFGALRGKGLEVYGTFGLCLGLVIFGSAVFLTPTAFYPFVLLTLLLVLLPPVFSASPELSVQKTGITLLAVFYVSILASHTVFIQSSPNGTFRMAFLYTMVAINDGFAEVLGRMVGHKQLCVAISPNKTVGGAVGGLVTVVGGSIVFSFLLPEVPVYLCALAGAITGMAGQAGDLVSSALKRDLGVKDFGDLFSSHGGMLDRFDSLIFTAPVFYYFLILVS